MVTAGMFKKTKSKKMHKKSISIRWFVNSLGVMVSLLIIFITSASFAIQSYVYNGIQQVLIGRSEELINVFSTSTSSDFSTISRAYIETFPDKNDMEIMSISKSGNVLVSSTGFMPVPGQVMPDYDMAINSVNNFGYWVGDLETGDKVMAITRVFKNADSDIEGSLRYMVSLGLADSQIRVIVFALISVGAVIILLISLSGMYFVRSIVVPVRKLTVSAKRISGGDFDVRIEKTQDDEIGQLIDNINIMAEELGNADRMKNDFISSVSHELRTPLTSIKGWAETLQVGDQDRATAEKGMSVIIKEASRLSGIVEELLDFSRIQNNRLSLIIKKIDLLAEIEEAVFMFTERAKTENKKLVYNEPAMISPVMGDVNRLKQVFINIIDNALKYTDANGNINVNVKEIENFICVCVEDNGCGIPTEHLPHVKKKFYKANKVIRGSGIGLALVDEIVTMHGGTLNIESTENKGTKVTVKIPICFE